MKSLEYLLAPAMAVAVALGVLQTQGVHAQSEQEYVPKAKVVTLHQAALPGAEGKEAIIKHFTLPPGFVGGRHYHPGPVFVYVLKGELTVEIEGGIETYKAGELYPEPLERTMQGKNLSTSDDLELVIFQVGDAGKPMMIKAE
jgi:quercetin dioxygenase-like cupin family protein